MDGYLVAKTVHVISSTVLFGTGLGIAFFFLMGLRSGDPAAAWFAARTTALADMLFTLTAGIVQPLSGFALIHLAGYDPWAPWLVWTYTLYLIALACWLPVVWLQLAIRDMLGRSWRARRSTRRGCSDTSAGGSRLAGRRSPGWWSCSG